VSCIEGHSLYFNRISTCIDRKLYKITYHSKVWLSSVLLRVPEPRQSSRGHSLRNVPTVNKIIDMSRRKPGLISFLQFFGSTILLLLVLIMWYCLWRTLLSPGFPSKELNSMDSNVYNLVSVANHGLSNTMFLTVQC